jgi:hypothetical protein
VAYVPAAENLGLLFRVPQKGESLQVLSVFGKGRFRPLATLSPDSKTSVGPMQIEYEGVFSETGLQYKYSPGDWPMLIGMGILVAGVLLAFGAKRLLWAVRAGDDIAVVAVSDRSKSLFVQEFRDLIAEAGS